MVPSTTVNVGVDALRVIVIVTAVPNPEETVVMVYTASLELPIGTVAVANVPDWLLARGEVYTREFEREISFVAS